VLSSPFSPALAPHVGQRIASICFGLSSSSEKGEGRTNPGWEGASLSSRFEVDDSLASAFCIVLSGKNCIRRDQRTDNAWAILLNWHYYG
jgi:hypothetical protein